MQSLLCESERVWPNSYFFCAFYHFKEWPFMPEDGIIAAEAAIIPRLYMQVYLEECL